MDSFASLLAGFEVALLPHNLLFMVVGVLLGVVIGVLPGLGAANGVALLLPLTFGMAPISGMILLTSLYWGALFGGSITSILFRIPGEPSSVATTFDGYPMAQAGRATEALTYAYASSAIGALAGVLLLTFTSEWLASFAIRFSPVEYFALYLLAFASFVGLSGSDPVKAVVSISLGLALTTIGNDTVSGTLRVTFGTSELARGISFLIAVIGLLGIGELLLASERPKSLDRVDAGFNLGTVLRTLRTLPRYWATYVRGVAIGCSFGIMPGTGSSSASLMSYALERRASRFGYEFGSGRPEGVIAPESADNAAGVSSMLPTLALAVPGSATAAVLLGGLMMWGLNPGPLLFVEQKEFVWGVIASMYLSNLLGVVVVLLAVPVFARILLAPMNITAPIIVAICAIGAYMVAGAAFDLWLLVIFGGVGYVLKKLNYPIAPLILAMVLGDKAEETFRQSMLLSGGDFSVFFSSTISVAILAVSGLILILSLIEFVRPRKRDAVIE